MKTFPALALLAAAATSHAVSLSECPEADTMRVGSASGRLDPAFYLRVESPMSVTIVTRFNGSEARLNEGTTWADAEPEKMRLERERLNIARRALNRKATTDTDTAIMRADLESRISMAKRNLDALNSFNEAPLADIDGGEALRAKIRAKNTEGKEAAKRQIELLSAKLTDLDADRTDELAESRASMTLREMDGRRIEETSNMTMPCNGVVKLLVAPRADRSYRLQAGEAFATIEDRSRFVIRIPAGTGFWRTLNKERLTVSVKTADGDTVKARFKGIEEGKFSGREEKFYTFEVTPETSIAAAGFAGGTVLVDLEYNLGEKARLVNLFRLASEHPEAFLKTGGTSWRDAVTRIWPKARVVAQSSSEIAVIEK
jgi:hypothetical protein